MADDRIELKLDLGDSTERAKQLGEALQTTKVDATAFGAALEALDAGQIKLVAETTAFQRALDKMALEEEQAAAATKRLAMEQQRLADEAMDKATRAAIEETQAQKALNSVLDTSHGSIGGVAGSTKNLGSTMLQTSYAVQDFTSQLGTRGLAGGLAAVQNNIPGILTSLGTTGGLAGVVSVAAVAVGLLYENWGKLREALGADDIGKRIEEMKALAKATEDVNAANEKAAKSVKGTAETDRASAFRKALADYGGGEKLLNEVAPPGAHDRGTYADAIAKALQGSENDIGFLKGGSQGLARELNRPALRKEAEAQDAEFERRAKEREKARKEQEKADEDARKAEEKQKEDEKKATNKLTDGLDKIIAGTDRFLNKDDVAGDRRRADIAERSGYGHDFKRYANNQGYNPLKGDLADAAKSIQADVKDGMSEEQALQNAMQRLIETVRKTTEINNRRAQQARQFQADVDNLPVLMDEGNQ
jgi:hypothetical protein